MAISTLIIALPCAMVATVFRTTRNALCHQALTPLSLLRYVTKRPIFMFISSKIRPSNLIQVFGFADDFSFGVLQSYAHWLWFVTKCES